MRRLSPLRSSCALLAALLLASPLAGCSNKTVLAKVGDREITATEFLDVAKGNAANFPGPPDSAKVHLLDELVNRQLLVLEAKNRKLVSESEQQRLRRQAEDRFLMQAFRQKMAGSDTSVSEAEVQALYKQRSTEHHLQVALMLDESSAREALKEIQGGADFGAVADRYNLTGMLPPRGDLGFAQPGGFPSPLDSLMQVAPVGKVVGPFGTPEGDWFLFVVTERRPKQQPPLDQDRAALVMLLQQRKQKAAFDRAFQNLLAQYHVQLEPGAGQIVFRRYNAPKDTLHTPAGNIPQPGPPTPAEARQVLARYDGADGKPAVYTLGDMVEALQEPSRQRPTFNMQPIIERWIRSSLVAERVALIEARRQHLQEEPATKLRIEEAVNDALLQEIYNTEVASKVTGATEEELRAAFQQYAAQMPQLLSARIKLAGLPDSAAAVKIAIAARETQSLDEAVGRAGAGVHVATQIQDLKFPNDNPLWGRLTPALTTANIGEVLGPVRLPQGWLLLQVLDKKTGTPDFASLDPRTRQALEASVVEQKRDRLVADLAAQLRAKYKPVIYRDRLAKVSWPAPAQPVTATR